MRVVTIVSLAASAVLGVGALVVAKVMLPNVAEAKGQLLAQTQGEPLVIATRAIKYGEKLQPTMLTVIKAPKDVIPEGAFTTVAAVLAVDLHLAGRDHGLGVAAAVGQSGRLQQAVERDELAAEFEIDDQHGAPKVAVHDGKRPLCRCRAVVTARSCRRRR